MTPLPLLSRAGVCVLLLLAPVRSVAAQEEVLLDRVREHLNRRVRVEGQVADVRRQPNGDVWLSLGSPYPKGPLVVVIPREMVAAHPDYANYRTRYVTVNGMVRPGVIEEHQAGAGRSRNQQAWPTKPSIVLDNPQRLELVPPRPEP